MAVTFDTSATSVTNNTASSPLAWAHTCGASADWILAGFALDGASGVTPANNPLTATYNSVSMTSELNWQTGGSGQTSGYLAVLALQNPATGAAHNVSGSFTNTGMDEIIGGSASVISGGGSLGTPVHSDSGGASATSGSITVNSTTNGSLVVVFVTNGSGGTTFTSGTSRFTNMHGGTAAGGAASVNCATIAGTGGSVTVNWTQTSDFYAAIAVEVKPPAAAAATVPAAGQPVRARLTGAPGLSAALPEARAGIGGVTSELARGTGNVSGAVRAGAGMGANGATVINPTAGPAFRQSPRALQARIPREQQREMLPGPRGRTYGISRGAPVRNPSAGPVFRQARQPIQAQDPLPRRGRCYATPKPVPQAVPPVFTGPPGLEPTRSPVFWAFCGMRARHGWAACRNTGPCTGLRTGAPWLIP